MLSITSGVAKPHQASHCRLPALAATAAAAAAPRHFHRTGRSAAPPLAAACRCWSAAGRSKTPAPSTAGRMSWQHTYHRLQTGQRSSLEVVAAAPDTRETAPLVAVSRRCGGTGLRTMGLLRVQEGAAHGMYAAPSAAGSTHARRAPPTSCMRRTKHRRPPAGRRDPPARRRPPARPHGGLGGDRRVLLLPRGGLGGGCLGVLGGGVG
jgi:hypothetical protein